MKRLLRDGVMEKLRKKGTKRDREKEMKIEKKRVREEGKERGNT